MKKKSMIVLTSVFVLLSTSSCEGGSKAVSTNEQSEKVVVNVPQFNVGSVYLYIRNQVDFSPCVLNTKRHIACGSYLAGKLGAFSAKVMNQYTDLIAHDGTLLKAWDIIGSYKPESKKRVALFVHWNIRPWVDNGVNEKNRHTPILGANDGASEVGALLGITWLVNQQQPELGIGITFLDTEDYRTPQFYEGEYEEEAQCLSSQYWSRNPHVQGYSTRFGILLDMVGSENSIFLKKGYSEEFTPDISKKVWKAAKKTGYGKTFIDERGDTVTDDHLFASRLARIKTIDITPNDPKTCFPPTWHTIHDNMDHIDKGTLKAVGQTVLEVIYNEKWITNQ